MHLKVNYKFVSAIILIIGMIIKYQHGPVLAPDSHGYLYLIDLRSPLYPLFLQLGSLNVSVLLQLSLGAGAIFAFIYFIKNGIYFFPLLVYPYASNLGNFILTESIAYPLFIVLIVSLLKRNFLASWLTVFLLILVRGQFLFLIPVLLIYSYLLERKKLPYVLLLIIAPLLEACYHKVLHNNFAMTPFSACHLTVAPFYNALDSDLKDPVVHNVIACIKDKGIGRNPALSRLSAPTHFYEVYDRVLYECILPLADKSYKDNFAKERGLKKLYWPLFKENFSANVILIFNNVVYSLGGYPGVIIFLTTLLMSFIIYEPVLITLLSAHMGNTLVIAISQAPRMRYSFYTELCYMLVFFSIGYYLWTRKKLLS